MKATIKTLNKRIEIKKLERFTRKLYIHRQKDRPIDEIKNIRKEGGIKNVK